MSGCLSDVSDKSLSYMSFSDRPFSVLAGKYSFVNGSRILWMSVMDNMFFSRYMRIRRKICSLEYFYFTEGGRR